MTTIPNETDVAGAEGAEAEANVKVVSVDVTQLSLEELVLLNTAVANVRDKLPHDHPERELLLAKNLELQRFITLRSEERIAAGRATGAGHVVRPASAK